MFICDCIYVGKDGNLYLYKRYNVLKDCYCFDLYIKRDYDDNLYEYRGIVNLSYIQSKYLLEDKK